MFLYLSLGLNLSIAIPLDVLSKHMAAPFGTHRGKKSIPPLQMLALGRAIHDDLSGAAQLRHGKDVLETNADTQSTANQGANQRPENDKATTCCSS